MANVLNANQQQLLAAAAGNAQLLELLQSLFNTTQATQTATNTATKNVPPQASATVSLLKGNYIVQILNPGQTSALSQIQAAQQSQGASLATSIATVTAILHQIRCATSPSFGVNDNVQLFGGNSGSTQTYWTLTNLGTGNFYFQFRSSYDGVNFNQWKNANGGQSVSSNPSDVTLEQQTNSEWAVFTLPGDQLVAVGEGFVGDEGTFTLPENLYSSAMAALAGPNGFVDVGRHVADIANSDVEIAVPSDTSGTVGIPDYPIVVLMKYGDQSVPQILWSGDANVFAIVWDPAGNNVTQYPSPDGTVFWVVFTLPGGAQIAVGSGQTPDGATVWVPPECPWIVPANLLSVCSPHGVQAFKSAHGVNTCQLNAGAGSTIVAACSYGDGSTTWSGNANWLGVASNIPLVALTGGKWLLFQLAGGNHLAFGAGQIPSGSSFQIPGGFATDKMLSIATPGSFTGSGGNDMHGVAQCDINETTVALSYVDGSGNSWPGNVNWLAFCWRLAPGGGPPAPPVPSPTEVVLTPNSATINSGSGLQFTATVLNNASLLVNWAVDGIAGGSSSVGVISGSGLYTAPSAPITGAEHTITATSVGDPSASATASVYVLG
jgi:hypothetical protein